MSFAPKVGGYFAPFLRFPLDNRVPIIVSLQPVLCSCNHLKKWLGLFISLQFGLALALLYPEDGIIAVGVDGLVVESLVPAECQCMDDGEKFPDVIRAVHRTIVEHAGTCLQVYGLVFHRSRISRACCIHRPSVCPHLRR